MKDILEFGRFVGRIVEAHNQGDTQRERQLANDAELHFDLYGIPDYDSETGRAVEETPFDEVLSSESRKDLDGAAKGEAYLQRLIQETQELKANAEAYLRQTEGQTEGKKAPGRLYMRRCADAAEGTLEYLLQLADKYQARRKFVSQTNTATPGECQGDGQSYTINPETGEIDGRESLCIHSEMETAKKVDLFKELCRDNVFVIDNSSQRDKENAFNAFNAFRAFVFGDVGSCSPDYKLKAQQGKLAAFLYALNLLGFYNGNRQYEIAKVWCTQKDGKELNPDSMSTTAGKEYRKSSKIPETINKYFIKDE